ncbi:hypothetical protein LXL04_037900 [Taraxacum kok-saghyz]
MSRFIGIAGNEGLRGSHIELMICMILVSMSIFSIIIFACGDSRDRHSAKTQGHMGRSGFANGVYVDSSGGAGGGGDGGGYGGGGGGGGGGKVPNSNYIDKLNTHHNNSIVATATTMARLIDLSGNNGGILKFEGSNIVFMLCMILVSMSILSMVIFACGSPDHEYDKKQRRKPENRTEAVFGVLEDINVVVVIVEAVAVAMEMVVIDQNV